MTEVTLKCRNCGVTVVLQSSRKGQTARVSIAAALGWHYDAENGWRCPKHIADDRAIAGDN